jgi:glycogen phosphorylase
MSNELTLTQRLWDIAMNLHWSWQPELQELFRELDPELWEATNHNPVALLKRMSAAEVERRGGESPLNTRILYAHRRQSDYMEKAGPLGGIKAGPLNAAPVAYFSAEFGIHECLPIYSGGLGILAGDHLKAASDMGIPLVGVGLLYANGYFHQWIDASGRQQERYEANVVENLPVQPAKTPDGEDIRFTIECPGGSLHVRVWLVRVGRVRLFLMDTDLPENDEEGRRLTDRLYGGDVEKRLRQEIILGIGGLRALRLAGIRPTVMHLNEGHCAFATLERARERIDDDGMDFHQAWVATKRQVCFTTHTPVPAGHDRFSADLIEEHLGPLRDAMNITHDHLMSYGRENTADHAETFCMTVLGLKLSRRANAVSSLHGEVSRHMWTGLYPGKSEDEVPIGHITNGVHVPSWLAPQMRRLYNRHLGVGWREVRNPAIWELIENVDDGELWETHMSLKAQLLEFIRNRALDQAHRRGETPALLQKLSRVMSPDVLTIGFARRFATYKRANLLLADMEMLANMVNDAKRPVQFVFAGKAHPKDEPGKKVLQQIAQLMRNPKFSDKFVFIEDYDINVGRLLVQGVDVWLNNPRRPLEASGTSGQKVVLNGGLNCSVLDGWWAEAYDGLNGFAIGNGRTNTNLDVHDSRDGEDLYRVLREVVIPLYYQRDRDGVPRNWTKRMKRTIRTLGWRFSADRMVMDYVNKCYIPAAGGTSSYMSKV